MKVDIWIYTEDGGEEHAENLSAQEAKDYLDRAIFAERFQAVLSDHFDAIFDTIKEKLDKELKNEV